MAALEHAFPSDHPATDGHFPGNPIIPGAVLLSETLRLIEAHLGVSILPCRVRRAKFPHPARPGDRMAIEFAGSCVDSIKFECTVKGKPVLVGEVECCDTSAV